MKTHLYALLLVLSAPIIAAPVSAQSLDDLNIQIHGYATQGFLYTTHNNIFTTDSSNGSPEWTEAVVNVTAQPVPKLRIGVQARYFLLGNFGNAITLDWALADYKVNDRFGVRFGKVKTPNGLLNEIQDIDPSYMWSLLPQSIYPITDRNLLLSHDGGVVYGTLKLGENAGKLEYRGWVGVREYLSSDGIFVGLTEEGINITNGLTTPIYGEALHWRTPLSGLMIGASNTKNNATSSPLADSVPGYGTFNGTFSADEFNNPSYFAQYEREKVMVAGEYSRWPTSGTIAVPGVFTQYFRTDWREWYGMASYKLTEKLAGGFYYSHFVDTQVSLSPARYSKDWAISGRYDFNQFLYAKAEQHFISGTALSYDSTLNPSTAALPTGLQPNTRLTVLKIGVSF